jgi:glutathione S-transferase
VPDLKLTVGDRNRSGSSLPPYLALAHAHVPFERQLGDEGVTVPALGEITGALAICEELARRFPAAQLWPEHADDLAAAKALATRTYPALESELPFRFLEKKPLPPLSAAAASELDALGKAWALSRQKYEKLGPWLVGKFSIADCMAAPFCSRALTYGLPLDKAYVETVLALPALKRWAEAAALDLADSQRR